jgi:hypothetical protein
MRALLCCTATLLAAAAPRTAVATSVPDPSRVRDDAALVAAVEAELARAVGAALPGQPAAWWGAAEVVDGDVSTAMATFGALTGFDHAPYRALRTELRVGDATFDSGDFEPTFGGRDGVSMRGLPLDDLPPALRREAWLAADHALKGATEMLSARRAAREGRPPPETPLPAMHPAPPYTSGPVAAPPAEAEATAALAAAISARLAVPGIEEGDAIARSWSGRRLLVTSEGTRGWMPTGFCVLRAEAIARDPDGARVRSTRSWVARTCAGLPPRATLEAETDALVAAVLARAGAPIEREYLGPVLFEAPAALELFRQVLAGEIAGSPPPEAPPDPAAHDGLGPASGARIGRRLLPDGWSVVDDPSAAPGSAASYTHDFEGVPATPVSVVEDGVVRALLHSRIPRAGAEGSTGHGRALGDERRAALPAVVAVDPPRPRSGRALRKAALRLGREAGLPYVLVVKHMEPLALAQDFDIAFSGEGPLPGLTRPTEVVRLYPDGREEPVRGLQFVGVDRRVLRDIAAAGAPGPYIDELDAAPGPGRYNLGPLGGLPVAWSVPAVVITEMELRGGTNPEPRSYPPPPVAAR